MYIIYDEFHAEFVSEKFETFESAKKELQRIIKIPFGEEPNKPPCAGWQNCHREYHIIEYNNSQLPWILLSDTKVLEISASEIKWNNK